jgi:CRP-like cAMP-binding protein
LDPFKGQPFGVVQFLEQLQDEQFCLKFELKKEHLLYEIECQLKRGKMTISGWLYICHSTICYKGRLFGYKQKGVIPLNDITGVTWDKSTLEIRVKDKVYSFGVRDPEVLCEVINNLIAEQQRLKITNSSLLGSPITSHNGPLKNTVEVLQDLTPSDWEQLLSQAECRYYNRGETVIKVETTTQALYNLTSGRCKVIGHGGTCLGYLTPDDGIFGEMSWIARQPASASIISDSDSLEVWILDGDSLNRAFNEDERLRARFFCFLARTIATRLSTTSILAVEYPSLLFSHFSFFVAAASSAFFFLLTPFSLLETNIREKGQEQSEQEEEEDN